MAKNYNGKYVYVQIKEWNALGAWNKRVKCMHKTIVQIFDQ